jgi:hypothetical protein
VVGFFDIAPGAPAARPVVFFWMPRLSPLRTVQPRRLPCCSADELAAVRASHCCPWGLALARGTDVQLLCAVFSWSVSSDQTERRCLARVAPFFVQSALALLTDVQLLCFFFCVERLPPIVDQLYDNVPTLGRISVCLISLRVVSPGDRLVYQVDS